MQVSLDDVDEAAVDDEVENEDDEIVQDVVGLVEVGADSLIRVLLWPQVENGWHIMRFCGFEHVMNVIDDW